MEIKIIAQRLPQLQERIEKVNKKAKKLNLPPLKIIENNRVFVEPSSLSEPGYWEVNLTVEGEIPFIAGWSLIGILEFGEYDVPVPRSVPGKEIPVELRNSEAICEHCNLNRKRNEIVVLQNVESKEYKRIGLKCVTDFLPGTSVEQIVWLAGIEESINEIKEEVEAGGYFKEAQYLQIENILALTNGIIRNEGWVSVGASKISGKTPTADLIFRFINKPVFKNEEERNEWLAWCEKVKPNEKDVEIAKETIEYVRNEIDTKGEYGYKLNLLFSEEYVSVKNLPIVISAVASYQNIKTKREEYAKGLNEHFGEVGKRYKGLELIGKSVKYINGTYGVTSIVNFVDKEGRKFVWFGSGSHDIEADRLYSVDGSIKGHDEYRGVKQTQLTRCKVA